MSKARLIPNCYRMHASPRMCRRWVVFFVLVAVLPGPARADVRGVVEVEEVVTTMVSGKNGAGPLWAHGAPLVVRIGDDVYASVIEAGKDVPPLCNMEWQLWRRHTNRWAIVQREGNYRQREPCPIAAFQDGSVFLSVNPSVTPPGTWYKACRPQVVAFDTGHLGIPPKVEEPAWADGTYFTDHSYRGFAADGANGALLLININNDQANAQFVSYRNTEGVWHEKGKIAFAVRGCYPQVALRSRSAHVLAVGDIIEPNEVWSNYKKSQGGSAGYVFRRLFYTFTPDIESAGFIAPIEVGNVEQTAGNIRNFDLYIDDSNVAHVLYLERPYSDEPIRARFFPDQTVSTHLIHAIIRDGKVISRRTLAGDTDDVEAPAPHFARFHVDPRGTLYVLMAAYKTEKDGHARLGNYLASITPGTAPLTFTALKIEHPFSKFFTNAVRGGSEPSETIDLFGHAGGEELRYARIRLILPRGAGAHDRKDANSSRTTKEATDVKK